VARVLFIVQDFVIEPLGLMSLAAVLKANNHHVELLKINSKHAEPWAARTDDEILFYAEKFAPDIIVYSITTGMHRYYAEINLRLKQKLCFLAVFGGMHASFFPDFINEEGVDVICRGEGEEAIAELANALAEEKSIVGIKNLWVKEKGKVFQNPLRPLIADIDKLPFPERGLIYRYKSSRDNPIKNFITTRGCPYKCSYCFNDGFYTMYGLANRKLVRSRSVKNVLDEIQVVKGKYPLKLVYFQDDILSLHSDFSSLMEKYSKEIGVPFHAHMRPDLINERIVNLLAKGGCLSITMSLESANDSTRNLLKRGLTKEHVYAASKLLHKYGIKFRLENMLGLPGETLKDCFGTLDMNIRCKPTIGWASLFQPYPGTELFNYAKNNNLFTGDVNEFNYSFFEDSVLKLEHKREIENLQKLFPLTVAFPFLRPATKQIIKLPPNFLFRFVHNSWKNYLYQHKLYKAASS